MLNDLRHGMRTLARSPGFSVVAILTLALGIGANTAIFSVLHAVVLRPLPFVDSEQLVTIWTQTPQVPKLPMAAANHRDLQAQGSLFEDIAIVRSPANYNLTGDGEPERLLAARIPANLFPLLRVAPLLGQNFSDDQSTPGNDHVVILSYGLWQRRFNGDSSIVGKSIRLESVPHTVVGVMAEDFQYPTRDIQVWTPLTINPDDFKTRTGYGHLAVARLKPGVTLDQAQAQLDLVATRLATQYPASNANVKFTVIPLRQEMAGAARKPLMLLLGSSLGLLLIGCCNLTNLLLSRALTRSHEIAVRSALGATQVRILRRTAAELLPILIMGLLLGVLGAYWFIKLTIPLLPVALPRVEEVRINMPVLLFSGCLLVASAGLVLLLPTLQATKTDLNSVLKASSRSALSVSGNAVVRRVLIVAQVALTVILLTGAGLLIRTFAALKDVELGFHPQSVLSLQLAIPRNKYPTDEHVTALAYRVLQQVRALPGVKAAGMGNRLPLSGASGLSTIQFERRKDEPVALSATDETTATPDYFQAMGIPLLQGRGFTEEDAMNSPRVVVIDERVAQRAWPGENPIGKRVRSDPNGAWAEVVGVVAPVRHETIDSDQRLQIYWNYLQRPRDRMTLVIRATGEAKQMASPVLEAIKAADPDQPAYGIRTMQEVVDQALAFRWFNTLVVSLFAGSSLLLAMFGIYGVMAWRVSQRTREIGVRMALGAGTIKVIAMVVRDGMTPVIAGLMLGIGGAFFLTRLLATQLYEVKATDPFTFIAVSVTLLIVALVASLVPAWQACRIDPMAALRME